jgi:hypothetical protein
MLVHPYSLVTDGRRTGIVTRVQGAMAQVGWYKKVPKAWEHLIRDYQIIPLMDLRLIEPHKTWVAESVAA